MSNEMNDAFATELRTFFTKYGKYVANVSINATGNTHYYMTVVAKSGASERVTFSTTNGATVKVYMKYANIFHEVCNGLVIKFETRWKRLVQGSLPC